MLEFKCLTNASKNLFFGNHKTFTALVFSICNLMLQIDIFNSQLVEIFRHSFSLNIVVYPSTTKVFLILSWKQNQKCSVYLLQLMHPKSWCAINQYALTTGKIYHASIISPAHKISSTRRPSPVSRLHVSKSSHS